MILISQTHQELKGDAAAAPPIFFSQLFFLQEARQLIDDALMTEGRSRMIGSVWFESRVTWRKLTTALSWRSWGDQLESSQTCRLQVPTSRMEF